MGPVLLGLAILLLVIMLLGHGMWVALAWLFRALGGDEQPPPRLPPASRPTSSLPLRDELHITIKQLQRLGQVGVIAREECDRLIAALRAELDALSPQGRAPAPREAPVQRRESTALEAPRIGIDAAAQQTPRPLIPEAVLLNTTQKPDLIEGLAAAASTEVVEAVLSEPAPAQSSPAKVHPLDRPYVPPPPAAPAQPGRSLADMLQSFMEESNIRWGEILAAMLIVLCSVGLVISLRNTLKNVPYFPAILFTLFTVAFHGAGMYTLRRWKVQAVSRVILLISLLLVPLTFCGAIVLQQTRPASDPLFLVALAAGVGIFTWVAWSASRELVGASAIALTICILGCSPAQVLIQRVPVAGDEFWLLNAVAAIPVASFLAAAIWQVMRARSWPRLSRPRLVEIVRVLGVAVFALLVPLALILVRTQPRTTLIANLGPQLSAVLAAVLALGLIIQRRTTARRLIGWQTLGTGILVLAGFLLVLLVAAAWPRPELLLAQGVMNAAILAALAVLADLPLLYVPSVACAALAATIAVHLLGGQFADRTQLALKLVQAALMGRTSLILSTLAAAVAGVACRTRHVSRAARSDQQPRDIADFPESPRLMLLASSGGLLVLAVAISIFSGFVRVEQWPQDGHWSAFLLLAYAAALLAASPFARRLEVPAVGSVLLWLGIVQALVFNTAVRGWLESAGGLPQQPWLTATLAFGLIAATIALFATARQALASAGDFAASRSQPLAQFLSEPLAVASASALVVAIPFIAWVRHDQFTASAAMALIAAAAWGMLVAGQRWPWAVSGLQGMLALAPALFIAGIWKSRLNVPGWLWNEQHLYAQFIAAALGAIVWSLTRRAAHRHEVYHGLVSPPWPGVDQALLAVATIGLPMLAFPAVAPAIGWELGYGFEPVAAAPADQAGWLANSRGWIALAVVGVALLVSLWETVSLAAAVGVGIASFAAVWLAAGQFAESAAAASGARWAAAVFAIVWAAAFIARDQLVAAAKRVTGLRWQRWPQEASQWFCAQPLLLGGTTILILTILAVQQHAGGAALHGPLPGTWFDRIGPTISYVTPLAALVGVLLAYAASQQHAGFALGGAGVWQLGVNLAYLLYVDPAQSMESRAIMLLQWNAIAAGAYALIWQAASPWITPRSALERERTVATGMWLVPLAVGGLAAGALVVWAGLLIYERFGLPTAELLLIGSWPSYLAVALTLLAVVWQAAGRLKFPGLGDAALGLVASVVVLVAASASAFDTTGQWLAYHTLAAGWLAVASAACAWVAVADRIARLARAAPHHFSIAILVALALAFAVHGYRPDPGQPWWALATALISCGIAVTLGLVRRSQLYAHAATILLPLAVFLGGTAPVSWSLFRALVKDPGLILFECLLTSVALAAGFWLGCEIVSQRRGKVSFDSRTVIPRVHAVTGILVVPLVFLIRLAFSATPFPQPALQIHDLASVATTVGFGMLGGAMLWDRRAWFALPLCFAWLATVSCLIIGLARPWLLEAPPRPVAFLLAAALQVALTSHLWSYGANLAAWGERWGVADPVGGLVRTRRWLVPLNVLLVVAVGVASVMLVLTLHALPLRVAAALGPVIAAYGLACLAQDGRRDPYKLAALLVAGLSAVGLAWAQIDPLHEAQVWLTRVLRLLMVLAALAFVYGLALPRFFLTSGPWNSATRKAGHLAGAAALVSLLATLGLEASQFQTGVGVPIDNAQVAAIAVVLVGLIAGLVSLALLPGRDPLVLTETGRQAYVYAAEIVAALLLAHLYLCRPLWFDGLLRPYWPFVVMALAFLGVGAAEIFARAKLRVLAEPLTNTSGLLPLLPVLGWWISFSETNYALVLLVVGVLYLVLSYTRRSWAAMLAAAVAGNGALWSLLAEQQFSFVANPQLWLIPPALSALVAAQVNRRRLAPEVVAAIRYAATIVIYVSSTSEIVTRGFAGGLWPPMVLLGLAVAGALAGIALRVRAFLMVGSTFTLVALIAMVRHAAQSVNNIWPWFVFGITLGVGILILFGLLEKKRTEVKLLIARLRQWER